MKNNIGIRCQAYGHLLGLVLLATPGLAAQAALTDLSDTPLVNDAGLVVRPNMMFVLDNSGSMDFNFTPDNVAYDANAWPGIQSNRGNRSGVCRAHNYVTWNGDVINGTTICGGANSSGTTPTDGGDPPFYSPQFNTSYYNPTIRYSPPPNPCNPSQSLPSMTDWTEVLVQGHAIDASCVQTAAHGKVNLLTQYPERVYCARADSSVDGDSCKQNGIDDTDRSDGDYDYPISSSTHSSSFSYAKTLPSHPHYYLIEPTQYCTDSSLTTCGNLSKGRQIPTYVRYCKGISSSTCQAKFDSDEGYVYPHFGNFIRHDIIPSITSYPKAAGRDDCAGATCTYAEEMTNFANWYAYYRTRMQTMKSAAGQAFSTIDDALRVGFVTINPGDPVDSTQYLPIADFDSTQKTAWYQKFYNINPNGGTPLREALSRVGRHYANVTGGINEGMPEDPVQYECQQNFSLLTTDGYWNGASGDKIDGSSIGNQDNVNAGYSTRAIGAFDGNLSGASNTLADVAMYYYRTDLRPGMPDKVPTNDKDTAPHQHMVTFTLGLGLDGLL
ncbi:MAG TPA: pyrrolo-quinoline quinone, partial [Methylophilaceae bacterium]|nr:pyrrolo-quinoline quinone [Methylophilaceae bacterium]